MMVVNSPGFERHLDTELMEAGLKLVGSTSNLAEAVGMVRDTRPSVVLVQSGKAEESAVRQIVIDNPTTKVIVLSSGQDRTQIFSMLRGGASGYLSLDRPPETIVAALETLLRSRRDRSPDLEGELPQALPEEETKLRLNKIVSSPARLKSVFQPILNLKTGQVAGFEALARFPSDPWRAPAEWFHDARKVGLSEELELAAARAALGNVHTIPARAFLALKVSDRTAASAQMLSLLESAPIERVVLQITHLHPKARLVVDPELKRLRARGLRLCLDDTRARHADLAHLLTLVPDFIKLDHSITHELHADPARRAVAFGLKSFAQEMGAELIGVGIESQAELSAVRDDLGAPLGQGFYLGAPPEITAQSARKRVKTK